MKFPTRLLKNTKTGDQVLYIPVSCIDTKVELLTVVDCSFSNLRLNSIDFLFSRWTGFPQHHSSMADAQVLPYTTPEEKAIVNRILLLQNYL